MADDRWTGSPHVNYSRAAFLCQGFYGFGFPVSSTSAPKDAKAGRGLGCCR